jgi:hypothetical protein
MYLTNWKETLPAFKHVPFRLEGNPPSRPFKGRVSKDTHQRVRMAILPEKASGYPDAQRQFLALTNDISSE